MNLQTVIGKKWSTVKPNFEDVIGKRIVSFWVSRFTEDDTVKVGDWVINTRLDYDLAFDETFVCYAVADEMTKPKQYQNIAPTIFYSIVKGDWFWRWTNFVESHSCRGFRNEKEARESWEFFVDKMEQIL